MRRLAGETHEEDLLCFCQSWQENKGQITVRRGVQPSHYLDYIKGTCLVKTWTLAIKCLKECIFSPSFKIKGACS